MIKTVTLNPAIDKTVEIDDFRVNTVNRITSVRMDAGGKGINVSKTIKALNGESVATGILAGDSGHYVKNYLDQLGIENDFLFINGETRTNLKVVDRTHGTNTDINEPGLFISETDLELFENKVFGDMRPGDLLVLSGSIPSSVPTGIYRDWTVKANAMGAKVLLDADGELLQKGIEAKPFLIKPNISELERLVGKRLGTVSEIVGAARRLVDIGIEMVAASLGVEGAVFVRKDIAIHAEGISVDVRSTVGAGDSMVASLALATSKGYTFERAVTLSAAAGTASVMTSGTQAPELSEVLGFEKQVKYTLLK